MMLVGWLDQLILLFLVGELFRRPVFLFRHLVHLLRKPMMDDVMWDEELAGCLARIVRQRETPMQDDGRAKVRGIGREVLGLEGVELAEKAHGEVALLIG
jgi:hypothetical protein